MVLVAVVGVEELGQVALSQGNQALWDLGVGRGARQADALDKTRPDAPLLDLRRRGFVGVVVGGDDTARSAGAHVAFCPGGLVDMVVLVAVECGTGLRDGGGGVGGRPGTLCGEEEHWPSQPKTCGISPLEGTRCASQPYIHQTIYVTLLLMAELTWRASAPSSSASSLPLPS